MRLWVLPNPISDSNQSWGLLLNHHLRTYKCGFQNYSIFSWLPEAENCYSIFITGKCYEKCTWNLKTIPHAYICCSLTHTIMICWYHCNLSALPWAENCHFVKHRKLWKQCTRNCEMPCWYDMLRQLLILVSPRLICRIKEGFVVTMHEGACETGSQIPTA